MLTALRYGLPAVLVVAGVLILAFGETAVRYDGFAMCVGSALALLLITFLWRVGISSDRDRDEEEAARRYLTEHGRWPDEDD